MLRYRVSGYNYVSVDEWQVRDDKVRIKLSKHLTGAIFVNVLSTGQGIWPAKVDMKQDMQL